MSQRLYQKLFRLTACTKKNDAQTRETDITLLSANASEMPIIATIDTDIKINGLKIQVTFRVIPDLVYDIILGERFLQQTEAIIDVGTNTSSLYRGLMSVPMIKANNLTTVKTCTAVTIPPFSQALFQVSPTSPVKPGDYMIKGQLRPPTGNLWIGRTLVNPAMAKMYCCALNISHINH
jgi:hypothetical protein